MGLHAHASLSSWGRPPSIPGLLITAATAPGTSFFKHQAENGDGFSHFLRSSRQGRFSVAVQGQDTDFSKTQLKPVGTLLDFENTVEELIRFS